MQFKSFTAGAAVLLALAHSALAGTVHIVNSCGVDVYYAAVGAGGSTTMQKLPSGYSQGMSGSVSVKLSTSASGGPVSQLEWTMTGSSLNYDMSNIDGYPFAQGGLTLTPSTGSSTQYPTCVPVHCAAGESVCAAAYNQPDDTRTLVCGANTDLTLNLCSGGSMKREEISQPVRRFHPRHLPKLA